MLAVGGDEHEQRRFNVHQSLNDGETVKTGHLDVQEHQIGFVGLDLADRLASICGSGDNFDVVERLQSQLQPLGGKRFVIDQNGPDGHQALSPVS